MQGVEKKNFPLDNTPGNESVTLDASELPVGGTYIYALIVDGQIIDAKTMICNK